MEIRFGYKRWNFENSTSSGVIVNELSKQIITTSVFDSNWVLHTSGLVSN